MKLVAYSDCSSQVLQRFVASPASCRGRLHRREGVCSRGLRPDAREGGGGVVSALTLQRSALNNLARTAPHHRRLASPQRDGRDVRHDGCGQVLPALLRR